MTPLEPRPVLATAVTVITAVVEEEVVIVVMVTVTVLEDTGATAAAMAMGMRIGAIKNLFRNFFQRINNFTVKLL